MAGMLAAVPDEGADGSAAAYPARSCRVNRDWIRTVAVSGTKIRSTLIFHSQSGHSGSSYSSNSGTSNSYQSNNSAAADFGTHELKTIAGQMASDGFTQRMVQAFSAASPEPEERSTRFSALLHPMGAAGTATHVYYSRDSVLKTWFLELDVDWVLQIRQGDGSQCQLRLEDSSGSSLQDLVERWIRGFTVIVHSIVELQSPRYQMTALKQFGKSSILKMLVFVDAMVPALKAQNLRTVIDMYICVSRALYMDRSTSAHFPLLHIELAVSKLKSAISSTMEQVKTLVEDDDSWAIEIPRGGGDVHGNTRWIVDCIVSTIEADAYLTSIENNDRMGFSKVRHDTINYLMNQLVRKSELSSDPSLRYLFLLNNSYFAAQMINPCRPGYDWKLTPECEMYMDSYLDVSWGHVMSCIPRSHFLGPLHRWINTDPLVKFESEFNKTYQAQKFWKVPDPRIRDVLRRAITDRVVSGYRDYLKEHPELAEHVSRRNTTPNVLEQMLGELFEG